MLPNGETLAPGVATNVGGVDISLAPSASVVVVGGSRTVELAPASEVTGGVVLPDGETLRPGVGTRIGGVEVSLAQGGTRVVVGGSTVAVTATGTGVGEAVWSAVSARGSVTGKASKTESGGEGGATETGGGDGAAETGGGAAAPSPSSGGAEGRIDGRGMVGVGFVGFVQVLLWV